MNLLDMKAPQLALHAHEIAQPFQSAELSFVLGLLTGRSAEDREAFDAAHVVICGLLILHESMDFDSALNKAHGLIHDALKSKPKAAT